MADAAVVSVLLQARDQASAQFKKVEDNMGRMAQSFSRHRRTIGLAATAIGGAITGIALLSVKSSLDQAIGIRRLDQSMKNVGTSYEAQKKQIEAVVGAIQNKTNFGDEPQREALQKLITIGGQWEGSLAALKITTDVAAGANIDLNAAALLVGKAIAGETSSLSRYGIMLEKGASQTEIMAALTKQFGGAAEAAANPLTQMKNRMGDLFQVMGDALLPALEKLVPMIEKGIRRVIEWTEAHPTLTKVLAIVATVIGGVLLVLGPMLLILPQLFLGMKLFAAGIRIVTAAMKANPLGLLLTAIQLIAIVALPLLIKNWDSIWDRIKSTTQTVVNSVIGLLNDLTFIWRKQIDFVLDMVSKLMELGSKLPFVGDKFKEAAEGIQNFSDKIKDGLEPIDITSESLKAVGEQSTKTSEKVVKSSQAMTTGYRKMATDFGEILDDMDDIDTQFIEKAVARQEEYSMMVAEINKKRHDKAIESLKERYLAEDHANRTAWQDEVDKIREKDARMSKQKDEYRQREFDKQVAENEAYAKLREEEFQQRKADAARPITDPQTFEEAGIASGLGRLGGTVGMNAADWTRGAGQSEREAAIARFNAITLPPLMTRMGLYQDRINRGHAEGRQDFIDAGTANMQALRTHIAQERARVYQNQLRAAAAGGIVPMGGANVLVGERGPEVVSLPGSSRVHPSGGGMGQVNNFHFHGSVYGVDDLREAVVEAVRDHAIGGGFAGVFGEP